MDKSINLKIRKDISEEFRELSALSSIIDAKYTMKNNPTCVPSEQRILAIRRNPDGTTSKIYALRKAVSPEMNVQNCPGGVTSNSMKQYCPPSGRTPYLPAQEGGVRRGGEFNPKSCSTPSQGKRSPSNPNPPLTRTTPNYQIYSINQQQPQCRASPAPLSESVLEEGAWAPKPQSPCPRRVSPPRTNNLEQMLKAWQKVRGSPIPPSQPRERASRPHYFEGPLCPPPQSFPAGSESQESEYSEATSFVEPCEFDASSFYALPTYKSSPCGVPIAPIGPNQAQGAIPKHQFRKKPSGTPPPVSPVNIIFMTPYQLTESGLVNLDKKSQKPLPEANDVSECSEESILMQQSALLACSCSENSPRQRIGSRKLLFDPCNDDDPGTPTSRRARNTCPGCSSKTSKSPKAQKQKSCLRKQENKQKDECCCSEESNDGDEGDEDVDEIDEEDGDDDACATNQPPSTPRESMKKLTVITRKDECGKQVNEIIEEDVYSDDCEGEVSVRSIVKGMDPFKYLEKRMELLENSPFSTGSVPTRNAPNKKFGKQLKCCPCHEKNEITSEKPASEGSANQMLNEVIDTILKSFEKIAKVITKRPLAKCVPELPSDRDKLNKLLAESIDRTESNMSLLRKNVADALTELSSIFARRAQKTVPEIEGLIKQFEKRLCPDDAEGRHNSK